MFLSKISRLITNELNSSTSYLNRIISSRNLTFSAQPKTVDFIKTVPSVSALSLNNIVMDKPPRKLPSQLNILDIMHKPENIRIPTFPVEYKEKPVSLNIVIDDPTVVIEKKAARLIVIRRRKMRRHKLKKLRIKMKFAWAKVRQRREYRKEKAFQSELMGQIHEAGKFDPKVYAAEKIKKANEVPLPVLWRGKRLPAFVIKDLLAKREARKQRFQEAWERRRNMNVNAADYKFD